MQRLPMNHIELTVPADVLLQSFSSKRRGFELRSAARSWIPIPPATSHLLYLALRMLAKNEGAMRDPSGTPGCMMHVGDAKQVSIAEYR